MPFTFSHPAIILPLNKKFNKYFDITALVLGSMAPDFEYFLHSRPFGKMGHTPLGFLILNLPVCFIVAYVFHKFIKRDLILSMRSPVDKWYFQYATNNWNLHCFKDIIIFIYSCLIGMISHVLWDSFTHINGYFVSNICFLNETVTLFNLKIPYYKILQHFSSLIGIMCVSLFIYFRRNKQPLTYYKLYKSRKEKFIFFILGFITSICICIFKIVMPFLMNHTIQIGYAVVTCINSVIIGIVVSCLISKLLKNKRAT